MPKNKPLETSHPESIEEAWHSGSEASVLSALVTKYAHVLDMTDSGRDIKPLATGMLEAMDRLKALGVDMDDESGFGEVLDEL